MNLPWLSWSSVAACLATTTGCRKDITVTAVASPSVLVCAATYARYRYGS